MGLLSLAWGVQRKMATLSAKAESWARDLMSGMPGASKSKCRVSPSASVARSSMESSTPTAAVWSERGWRTGA
jgi:hypothetical protein